MLDAVVTGMTRVNIGTHAPQVNGEGEQILLAVGGVAVIAQLHLDVDHGVGDTTGGVDPRIRFDQPEMPGVGHGDEGCDAGRAAALDGVAG